jgi:hypothetical protein
MLLIKVSGLHVHVESPFAAAGLDAGNTLHLGGCLQVLEVVGFVDEDVIDAEFVQLCAAAHYSMNVELAIMWSRWRGRPD